MAGIGGGQILDGIAAGCHPDQIIAAGFDGAGEAVHFPAGAGLAGILDTHAVQADIGIGGVIQLHEVVGVYSAAVSAAAIDLVDDHVTALLLGKDRAGDPGQAHRQSEHHSQDPLATLMCSHRFYLLMHRACFPPKGRTAPMANFYRINIAQSWWIAQQDIVLFFRFWRIFPQDMVFATKKEERLTRSSEGFYFFVR